jgi:Urea amidohydrolase (urease) alpha subunit
MFGALGRAKYNSCLTFVSRAALDQGVPEALHLQKKIACVSNCRTVSKRDMLWNDAMPVIEVDPETYQVRADGEHLTCAPLPTLSLAQRYFLF